jgi:lipopolysaccharide export system permease protein
MFKFNSIINRYVFREMLPPFAINLVFFSFIFLMTKILFITNLIVNYHIGMAKIGWLLVYSMPTFLIFVIPMSVMMAVLLAFLRMSVDNEIIALKTGGVSLYRLLLPAMAFCCMGWGLTAFMAMYGSPWGKTSFQQLVYDVAASNVNVGLKERTFNDSFDGVMLYAQRIDLKENILRDVFIEDQRNEKIVTTIVAPKAKIFSNPEKLSYLLRLYDGSINQVNIRRKVSNAVTFETYDLSLEIKTMVDKAKERSKKDEEEMYVHELIKYLQSSPEKNTAYYKTLIELHNRFSIPLSCLALGILAIPLGVQSKSSRKSYGLGLGLFFFILYYLLLSMGWVLGKSGTYPPVIGVWMPNLIMGGIGIILLLRTATENPVHIHGLRDLMKRAGFKMGG